MLFRDCPFLVTSLILAVSCCGCDAHYATKSGLYNSNSTTSSSSVYYSTTTSSVPASITSCGGTVDLFEYFVPSLLTQPDSVLSSIFLSDIVQLEELNRNLQRIRAGVATGIPNTAAFVSYYVSVYIEVETIINDLFGPAGTAIVDYMGITDDCLFQTCVTQFLSKSSVFRTASPTDLFEFTADPPCCGQCVVAGLAVQLEYWPTPAPNPSISVLIDGSNHTYVSPSVYGIFTGLAANDYCSQVGPSFDLKTITFDPSELSTSSILVNPSFMQTYNTLGAWTAIDFADFNAYVCPSLHSPRVIPFINGQISKCKCTTNCVYDPVLEQTLTDICTPQLSLPKKVTELDPAWAQCASDYGGVFDPPIALTAGGGLTPPKTTILPPPPPPTTTLSVGPTPAPVNTPTPPGPSPTLPAPTVTPIISTIPLPVNPTSASNSALAGVSSIVPAPIPVTTPPVTISGITLTPVPGSSSVFIVNSQTLSPGGPALTVSGTTISLPPSGTAIIINGATTFLPVPSFVPAPVAAPLTINGQTITANSASDFIIGSQTLVPGGQAITVSGTVISLSPGGTQIIVGGTTSTLGSIITSVFSGTDTGSGTGTVLPAQYTGAASRSVKGGFVERFLRGWYAGCGVLLWLCCC